MKEIDFAHAPVDSAFRELFFPTLISMLSVVILTFCDGIFVGHGVGGIALAAVNIASPIYTILSGIGMLFGIGASIGVSFYLSKGKTQKAREYGMHAVLASFFIGTLTSVLILSHLTQTCELFGSNDALTPLASDYLFWIALCEPLAMLDIVLPFLIRLDGNPRFSMRCSVVASGLNIVLDYVFIFICHWGITGAAIGTAIAFSASGLTRVVYLGFFAKTLKPCRILYSRAALSRAFSDIATQVQRGFSIFLGEIAISGVVIVGNFVFVSRLGEDGVAAYGVACYTMPLIYMMADAIAYSAQPIISFAFGVSDEARLWSVFKLIFRLAIIAGVVIVSILFFGAPYVAALFLKPTEPAFELSVSGLPYFGLGALFVTLNVVLIGYVQSIDMSRLATFFMLARGFIFLIPAFMLLPQWMGTEGMWLAIPVSEMLTSIAIGCVIFYAMRGENI